MTPDVYSRVTSYLAKFYGVSLYERQGRRHPVVVHAAPEAQTSSIDSVIGALRPHSEPGAIYDYGHLHTLQNSGRSVYNGDTYALHYLETHPLKVHAQPGRYFDMLATCDALDRELVQAAGSRLIRLPLRQQLHRTLPAAQAVWRGAGRSAAIGGACLIVFRRAGRYEALMARRSARSASDASRFHVLPAFIVQPIHGDWAGEWNFGRHILREYLEELYGVPEGARATAHPAAAALDAMLRDGRASLHLTGVAVNLLTLRAELCALLLIHNEGWWEEGQRRGDTLAFDAGSETLDGRLTPVLLEDDEALAAGLPAPMYIHMPPQAYAALWLGVDLARRLTTEAR